MQARNAAQKKLEKAQLEAKRVAHKMARMEKESSGAEKLIESLLVKYPWIQSVIAGIAYSRSVSPLT